MFVIVNTQKTVHLGSLHILIINRHIPCRGGVRFLAEVVPRRGSARCWDCSGAVLDSRSRQSRAGARIEAETAPNSARLETEYLQCRGSSGDRGRPPAGLFSRPRSSRPEARLQADHLPRQGSERRPKNFEWLSR